MTVEDALRKIALLRRISTDKGALAAERATAHRLQKVLIERYAIRAQDIPDAPPTTVFRLSWSYWQELFEEFDLRLNHFGSRGSANVGNNSIAYIMLATNQWWIEERSPGGWQTTTRGGGVESLRKYLKDHAPRSYSFLKR
ncbi:MAG: hypothetical protein WCA22_20925 [Candidatus Binatus sp.]